MSRLKCPQCGAPSLRRSRSRGLVEKVKKVFGWKAFRCKDQDCDWRGLIRLRSSDEGFKEYLKNNVRLIAAVIMYFVLAFVVIWFVWYLIVMS